MLYLFSKCKLAFTYINFLYEKIINMRILLTTLFIYSNISRVFINNAEMKYRSSLPEKKKYI